MSVDRVTPRPLVETLHLGSVRLPDSHPRAAAGTCTIDGFLIHHPDGPVLVNTGVAEDHPVINEMYEPTAVSIIDAVNAVGVDERDLVAIVNTHLHFDHCGQNRLLPEIPVYVQSAELVAAAEPRYTVPEWADIETARQRVVDGDMEIAPGLRLVATPGHTPGHQSVVIDAGDERALIVGQCCYTCGEYEAVAPFVGDMHDEAMLDLGTASLERLRSLQPDQAYFSHDRTVFTA